MGAEHEHRPFQRGSLVALLAALSFGVTAPLVKLAGRGLGPFSTAALLYLGAALQSAPSLGRRHDEQEAPLRASDAPRLLAIAVFGAVLAPAALAWGLQHTSAASASLLLNAEALFTALLAWLIYREHLGRRVGLALGLMVVGSAWLVGGTEVSFSWGAVAVIGAALGWGLDNTVARALADRNPAHVVAAKAGLGAALACTIALVLGEPTPSLLASLALLALGATGYGMSLRLYIAAQRRIGAARTGSVFAIAPFVGAAVAVALGEAWPARAWIAALLFVAAVYLHLSEQHGHEHQHESTDHEHAHRHDDGHHDHTHEPPVAGVHSHRHAHRAQKHAHPHAPDLHHQHRHDHDEPAT